MLAKDARTSFSDVDTSILYTRATTAEHAGDFDTAFGLYLSAAQAFLHRARTLPTHSTSERSSCNRNAEVCLERAERIKAARRDTLKPLVRDPLSREEQMYILDKSSKVHGLSFPVWSNGEDACGRESDTGTLPPFGAELLPSSPVWRRPSDVYGTGKLFLAGTALEPRHIHQNIVSDCSVCSAAAICLHHHRMFGSKLGLSCMIPQDSAGSPSISRDGSYNFRFFINGAFRKVSIDDRLPFTGTGKPVSVIATLEDGSVDVWPALLEKAYLKLMGGYDFPGSNSSIDVHALTGWIPEHIEINSSAFVREKVFRRIFDGFNQGLCVLTLGTAARGPDVALFVPALDGSQTKLLPAHSYAVLAIHEESHERYLTILNPWNASSNDDGESGIMESLESLHISDRGASVDAPSDRDDTRYSDPNDSAEGTSSNLIDISWDEVCSAFDGLYLNWSPSLFKRTLEFHGAWRSKAGENTPNCVHYYLSLDLKSTLRGTKGNRETDHDLWVLLTRHVVDKQRTGEFIALHAIQSESEECEHDVGAVDTGLDLKGLYTSSTHTLTRMTATGAQARVALIASYDGPYSDVCFTVQAFCHSAELSWVAQPRKTAYESLIEGTFSSRNAGGNNTYPTFMNNPQYRLKLHTENVMEQPERGRKSIVRLNVEGPRDVPLNVMLIWRTEEESRERVYRLRSGDTVASSGPYSYGVAQAAASLTPGYYCIVVSTFEPRHRGKFTLRIESAMRMDLEDIPAEGAGMFCKPIKGLWRPGADGGSPQFGNYNENPMFEITARTATTLKLRLQLTKPSASIALNVTLFASSAGRSTPDASLASSPSLSPPLSSDSGSLPRGTPVSLDRQIVTSGAYVDGSHSPAGVVTPQTVITPGKYIAVVSTFDPGIHAAFQLLVFSKADVKVLPILFALGTVAIFIGMSSCLI